MATSSDASSTSVTNSPVGGSDVATSADSSSAGSEAGVGDAAGSSDAAQSAELEGGDSDGLESSDADVSDEVASDDFQQNEVDTEEISNEENSYSAATRGEMNERAPKAVVAVMVRSSDEASAAVIQGDALATQRTVGSLNLPELSGRRAPTPAQISGFLQQLRQNIVRGRTP